MSVEHLIKHWYKPTHGKTKTPEFMAWSQIIDRCTNPKSRVWYRYGGRGISICDSWKESFTTFLAAVGERPTPEHSIDRIDNDGNYEPGNVKWSTRKQQTRNRRSTRLLTYKGETMCVSAWAEKLGVSAHALLRRLNSMKWSVEKTISTPLRFRSKNR